MGREIIEVRHTNEPSPALAIVVVVGVACFLWQYIGWILFGLGVVAVGLWAWWLYRKFQEENARINADIAEMHRRADRQLYGYMSGDPRATYGGWDEGSGR